MKFSFAVSTFTYTLTCYLYIEGSARLHETEVDGVERHSVHLVFDFLRGGAGKVVLGQHATLGLGQHVLTQGVGGGALHTVLWVLHQHDKRLDDLDQILQLCREEINLTYRQMHSKSINTYVAQATYAVKISYIIKLLYYLF